MIVVSEGLLCYGWGWIFVGSGGIVRRMDGDEFGMLDGARSVGVDWKFEFPAIFSNPFWCRSMLYASVYDLR